MTQQVLPKCPTCGAVPEWRWKVNNWGSSFATLKCPYGHHKTHRTYQVGAESLASENLIKQWNELISGVTENV